MIKARSTGPVLCEQHGGVLLITFNRPEQLNSFTAAMKESYYSLLAEANADPDIRAVVVTGSGRAFCAGVDTEDLLAIVRDPAIGSFGFDFHDPLLLDKPLIAAINGGCAGVGFVEALFCDVRFAARGAKFSSAFVRRGVIAEHGSSFLLSRIVGDGHARDILLSGRVLTGEEAERIGLVNRSVPRDEVVRVALEYAREIAESCSPGAIKVMKQQLRDTFLDSYRAFARRDLMLAATAFAGADFAEGVRSYTEKRAPEFAGVSCEMVSGG